MRSRLDKAWEYVLGELLFLANSSPSPIWKKEFYAIKDKIINLYGEFQETHLQHIQKVCYNCDGEGKLYQEVMHLGELERIYEGPCRRCNSSGVYRQFWSILALYKVGRRLFHMPLKRISLKIEIPDIPYAKTIEGHVEHKPPKFYLNIEAGLWLLLLFAPRIFVTKIGRLGCPSRKFTPMVLLTDTLYRVRDFQRNLRRIGARITDWRQANCDHMFPEHDHEVRFYYDDVCPWCGIKRWDVDCPF